MKCYLEKNTFKLSHLSIPVLVSQVIGCGHQGNNRKLESKVSKVLGIWVVDSESATAHCCALCEGATHEYIKKIILPYLDSPLLFYKTHSERQKIKVL